MAIYSNGWILFATVWRFGESAISVAFAAITSIALDRLLQLSRVLAPAQEEAAA